MTARAHRHRAGMVRRRRLVLAARTADRDDPACTEHGVGGDCGRCRLAESIDAAHESLDHPATKETP